MPDPVAEMPDSVAMELSLLRACASDIPIAAVDTSLDLPAPARTLDGAYDAVRVVVNRVQSAQVGLALLNHGGELALGGRVWRFHLGDGHDDADPCRVCEAFRACRRTAVPQGIWVTRDGAADVADLVRHQNSGNLPSKRETFLKLCKRLLPYSVRPESAGGVGGREQRPTVWDWLDKVDRGRQGVLPRGVLCLLGWRQPWIRAGGGSEHPSAGLPWFFPFRSSFCSG